jgi:hypothetical protein
MPLNEPKPIVDLDFELLFWPGMYHGKKEFDLVEIVVANQWRGWSWVVLGFVYPGDGQGGIKAWQTKREAMEYYNRNINTLAAGETDPNFYKSTRTPAQREADRKQTEDWLAARGGSLWGRVGTWKED